MTEGKFRPAIRYPRTDNPVPLAPRQVGQACNFPLHLEGTGYLGGIIELGGGYKPAQVKKYFTSQGLPVPVFTDVSVSGGTNSPDGPDGADGEVQLDMIVAGAIAPGAQFNIYFCPNTDEGFLAGIAQARADKCDGISISWGGPEDSWDPNVIRQFEAAIAAARTDGVPVFVAAGDAGSKDGEGHNVVDFPASAPSAIGCGGTRLTLASGGARKSEVVWNDDPASSATGGGVSKHFPGRQVPDVAANADPDTGYELLVDGQGMVVGGTSAVAPLMLGLHALLRQSNAPFDFLNLIVTNPQACYDVTQGDNGGFRAGPGRDETTGFGVPDGSILQAALSSGIPAPAPPNPAPAPTPPPEANPLGDFPAKTVGTWIGTHTYTHLEERAKASLQAWAAEYGVTL